MGLGLDEVHSTIENLKTWGYSVDQAIELLKLRELSVLSDILTKGELRDED